MKKRFNIKEKWKAILTVFLVIGILGGTFGIIFTSVKKGSAKSEIEEITESTDKASKIGLYQNTEGVLNYTYYKDYRFMSTDELGFDHSGVLASNAVQTDSWLTVKYDRGTNPYLELGKDSAKTSNNIRFSPVSTNGEKVVFETDFCWMGTVNGIGSSAEYDTDPTWHVQLSVMCGTENAFYLRFKETQEEGVFDIDRNNKSMIYRGFNIGEWYNLRIEIVPSNNNPNLCEFKVYLDNILVESYEGIFVNGSKPDISNINSVLIDQRYHSNDSVLLLDNTYFSKR